MDIHMKLVCVCAPDLDEILLRVIEDFCKVTQCDIHSCNKRIKGRWFLIAEIVFCSYQKSVIF